MRKNHKKKEIKKPLLFIIITDLKQIIAKNKPIIYFKAFVKFYNGKNCI